MNWFKENKFMGGLAAAVVVCALIGAFLLFRQKSAFDEENDRNAQISSELTRLAASVPYPSDANYKLMKAQAEEYASGLNKLKEEIKTRVLPVAPLAPNEFQTRLRQAVAATVERARSNHVKLPENFYLGFNDFTAALPTTAAAPLLGQQLEQIMLATNIVIDAHVDAIVGFHRSPLPEERGGTATPTPTPTPANTAAAKGAAAPSAAAPKLIDRSNVDVTFVSTPAASRKVLNEIASAQQQLFIVRALHVRNEKDKGPPREQSAEASAAASKPEAAGANLKFIAGMEKVQTSARIEVLRVAAP
jgi:hypothetical protein